MMALNLRLPDTPGMIPEELKTMINLSVQRFQERFRQFGLLHLANTNGWIADYRSEITGAVISAYMKGRGDNASTTPKVSGGTEAAS